MNTSETNHALGSAVFPTTQSGILPDAPPPEILQTNFGHSTLDSGLHEAPDSPDFNNLSRSLTKFNNENSDGNPGGNDHHESVAARRQSAQSPSESAIRLAIPRSSEPVWRRPRPDSVLLNLSEEDREQLNEWLLPTPTPTPRSLNCSPVPDPKASGVCSHGASLSRGVTKRLCLRRKLLMKSETPK